MEILGPNELDVGWDHVAGGKQHHVARDHLGHGNFRLFPVAQHRGRGVDHLAQFLGGGVGLGLLDDLERHAQDSHADDDHGRADIIGGVGDGPQNKKQEHQRVFDCVEQAASEGDPLGGGGLVGAVLGKALPGFGDGKPHGGGLGDRDGFGEALAGLGHVPPQGVQVLEGLVGFDFLFGGQGREDVGLLDEVFQGFDKGRFRGQAQAFGAEGGRVGGSLGCRLLRGLRHDASFDSMRGGGRSKHRQGLPRCRIRPYKPGMAFS